MDDYSVSKHEANRRLYKPSPISPVMFAEAMRRHWEGLGNCSSDKLVEQWRGMGDTFSRAVLIGAGKEFEGQEKEQWQVLQPPTGTGKTQGACVYAAMVAKLNRSLHDQFDKTGILIVSPFIEEANSIATTINRLAGFECAVARHSENRIPVEEMAKSDVLVVTHKAYVNALEDVVLEHGDDRLDRFLWWQHGPRFLTIIDESLSELIKSYHATVDDFRFVASQIDLDLKTRFPWAAKVVTDDAHVVTEMETLLTERDPSETKSTKQIWSGPSAELEWQENRREFRAFRREMAKRKYDVQILGYEDRTARTATAKRIDRTLATIEAMRAGAGYRSGTGGKFTIHTSKLLMPSQLAGPVILDATASQEPIWSLLGRQIKTTDKAQGVRNYKNVTLHVAWAAKVGQDSMRKNASTRLSRLFDDLAKMLNGRSVFICLHKDLESRAMTFRTDFADCSIDHWGHINGRNDWQEFDTAVLFGLPYLPKTWAFDLIQAAQPFDKPGRSLAIETEKMRNAQRSLLQIRQIASSVIQAINRIRCRRVIDDKGNCAEADIFITLPNDKIGKAVLSRIEFEMPGIKIKRWEFALDGERRAVSKAHYAEPVINYMKNCEPGETDIRVLCQSIGLTDTAKKDLQADLRGPDNPLTRTLNEMHVTYHSTGRGRGARSYLLRR